MVCAAPGLILAIALVLAAAAVGVLATRFNVVNNSSDLLSDKTAAKQSYNELVSDFGSDSRFIILIQSDDVAKNRQAADEIGPWLETLKPQISTVLYKIDYSSVKPRLLFTAGIDQLKKIDTQVENDVKEQQRARHETEQTALDLNSILSRGQRQFNDSYLREKSTGRSSSRSSRSSSPSSTRSPPRPRARPRAARDTAERQGRRDRFRHRRRRRPARPARILQPRRRQGPARLRLYRRNREGFPRALQQHAGNDPAASHRPADASFPASK